MDVKIWVDLIELGLKIGELELKIVVAIGAGAWAVALFLLLRQRELAQAALRKSEAELRDIEKQGKVADAQILDLELKAKQQAVVTVTIQSTVRRSPEGGYILLAVVKLANRGSRNTKINWKGELPAFYVRQVKFDADGMPSYDLVNQKQLSVPLTKNPEVKSKSHILRAGGTESIHFPIHVSISGVYLLSFRGVVDKQERAEAAKVGAKSPVAWTGNRLVFVGDE
jgi:hypothetical protein